MHKNHSFIALGYPLTKLLGIILYYFCLFGIKNTIFEG